MFYRANEQKLGLGPATECIPIINTMVGPHLDGQWLQRHRKEPQGGCQHLFPALPLTWNPLVPSSELDSSYLLRRCLSIGMGFPRCPIQSVWEAAKGHSMGLSPWTISPSSSQEDCFWGASSVFWVLRCFWEIFRRIQEMENRVELGTRTERMSRGDFAWRIVRSRSERRGILKYWMRMGVIFKSQWQ